MRNKFAMITLAAFGFASFAHAEPEITAPPPEPSPYQEQNHIEIELAHSSINNGFQDWNDLNILNYFTWKREQLVIETDYKSHFGESAFVVGATDTHTYSERWYQDFSLAASTDDAIIPGFIAYTELHHKFLADESLIGGIGVGYNLSESPYTDTYGLIEATYYFGGPISLQAGIRLNNSSPGSVFTTRYFGNLNFLYDRFDGYVRYETGREGYTVVGPNEFANQFSSQEEEVQVHYWYSRTQGLGFRVDLYQASIYNREEVAVQWLMKY